MPFFFVRVLNSVFDSRDDGADYSSAEAALQAGVSTAMAMLGDEVAGGTRHGAIEVTVEDEWEQPLLRNVVAVSVSALFFSEPPPFSPIRPATAVK